MELPPPCMEPSCSGSRMPHPTDAGDYDPVCSECAKLPGKKPLSRFTRTELETLASATRRAFEKLAEGQHEHTTAMIASMLDGMTAKAAAELIPFPTNTIYKYRSQLADDIYGSPIFESSAKKGVKRARAADKRNQARMETWLGRYEVTKSGEKTDVLRTEFNVWESFEEFKATDGAAGGIVLFRAAWKNKRVKVAKCPAFDFFSCTHCNGAEVLLAEYRMEVAHLQGEEARCLDAEMKHSLQVSISLAQSKIAELENHIKVVTIQRDAYQKMRSELDEETLMLTIDFGTRETQGGKLPDLVMVAHYRVNGEIYHLFLDCLPANLGSESKDWNYVKSVFMEIYRTGFFVGYKKLILWSDTGPNHFRVSNTLYFLRQFELIAGLVIQVFYFAPHHGHSQCDGHIGAASRMIAKASKKLAGNVAGWDAKWVKGMLERLANTHVVAIPIVRVADIVSTLVGIRSYLCFTFDQTQTGGINGYVCAGALPKQLKFEFAQ